MVKVKFITKKENKVLTVFHYVHPDVLVIDAKISALLFVVEDLTPSEVKQLDELKEKLKNLILDSVQYILTQIEWGEVKEVQMNVPTPDEVLNEDVVLKYELIF